MPEHDTGTRRRLGLSGLNSVVQTLAILGAGAWAVYTFIYEAKIKPSLEPAAVSVKTDLVKAGERGERVAIRSTVTRTNVGQTGVSVLGLTYTVVGLKTRVSTDDRAQREAAFEAALGRSASVGIARDYVEEAEVVILRQGVLFSGGTDLASEPSDLNPGETVSRDLILYADRGRFDAVRVTVSLAYAKEGEAVRLRFETGREGELALAPAGPCPAGTCPLRTTDFATEFSLW